LPLWSLVSRNTRTSVSREHRIWSRLPFDRQLRAGGVIDAFGIRSITAETTGGVFSAEPDVDVTALGAWWWT